MQVLAVAKMNGVNCIDGCIVKPNIGSSSAPDVKARMLLRVIGGLLPAEKNKNIMISIYINIYIYIYINHINSKRDLKFP